MAIRGYWREIAAILLLKAAGLAALYFLFIAPALQAPVTPASVANHLSATASQEATP